jgi:hypothetical protein
MGLYHVAVEGDGSRYKNGAAMPPQAWYGFPMTL